MIPQDRLSGHLADGCPGQPAELAAITILRLVNHASIAAALRYHAPTTGPPIANDL